MSEFNPLLIRAIRILRHGGILSFDLAVSLLEMGYDVTSLEQKYGR